MESKSETKTENYFAPLPLTSTLSLTDAETLPWTKHKENIQLLGCALGPDLEKLIPDKQARLRLTEEFERTIATFATRDPRIAKSIQAAADDKTLENKAKQLWEAATKGDYDKCMELIDGESERLTHIAYDGLIFNVLGSSYRGTKIDSTSKFTKDGIEVDSKFNNNRIFLGDVLHKVWDEKKWKETEDTKLAKFNELLDEWIAKAGPYKIHSRSIYQNYASVDGRDELIPFIKSYESKKVQVRIPEYPRAILERFLHVYEYDLVIQLCQKWSDGHRVSAMDWLGSTNLCDNLRFQNYTPAQEKLLTGEGVPKGDEGSEKAATISAEMDKLYPGRIYHDDGNDKLWKMKELSFDWRQLWNEDEDED